MLRIIKPMENKYLKPSLDLVEDVFTAWDSPEEAKTVRALVEEIRAKKYYLPELELVMVDENDRILGYAMFSRFHLEDRYENELLILTPVAVRTEYQRQHISKELIEYGFKKAAELGYKAVLVEGDPKNYNPRGFVTSCDHGIIAGPNVHLPHPACLMVKELVPGALEHISGTVDYAFYDALHEDDGQLTCMKRCYELAVRAGKKGFDTFGALLVHNGKILEEAENTADWERGIFGHAEFNLVHKCADRYPDSVLKESVLYTSCAPCERCLCAIASLGVENVVFGVSYEAFSKLTPDDAVPVDREGLLRKLGIRMKLTGPVLEEEGMHVFEWWGGTYRPLEELIAEMAEVKAKKQSGNNN